jgi:hypothetical protein
LQEIAEAKLKENQDDNKDDETEMTVEDKTSQQNKCNVLCTYQLVLCQSPEIIFNDIKRL